MKKMEEANKIIEDFPIWQYAVFTMVFLLETALCFWLGLAIK